MSFEEESQNEEGLVSIDDEEKEEELVEKIDQVLLKLFQRLKEVKIKKEVSPDEAKIKEHCDSLVERFSQNLETLDIYSELMSLVKELSDAKMISEEEAEFLVSELETKQKKRNDYVLVCIMQIIYKTNIYGK